MYMCCDDGRLCVYACVCVPVPRRIPANMLHGPVCNFGEDGTEYPRLSCALLGGFAFGARVSLPWQHKRLMRNVSEDSRTRCIWLVVCCDLVDLVSGKVYCLTESFIAQCLPHEIIIVESATFGRMQIGRCVAKNYGHLGYTNPAGPPVHRHFPHAVSTCPASCSCT